MCVESSDAKELEEKHMLNHRVSSFTAIAEKVHDDAKEISFYTNQMTYPCLEQVAIKLHQKVSSILLQVELEWCKQEINFCCQILSLVVFSRSSPFCQVVCTPAGCWTLCHDMMYLVVMIATPLHVCGDYVSASHASIHDNQYLDWK
jgi:hypothetical protein